MISEREARLTAEYKSRLSYLYDSYNFATQLLRQRLTYNESLKAAERSLNPATRKRKCVPSRLHPGVELRITIDARKLAVERGLASGLPNQTDINASAAAIVETEKARRGRPADPFLAHFVHAFMALHRETCGKELRANLTRNGEYAPYIRSPMQDTIVQIFRDANPAVTLASVVDIIVKAHQSNVVRDKRFSDFCPFYKAVLDAATGIAVPAPGHRWESFTPVIPIYSS